MNVWDSKTERAAGVERVLPPRRSSSSRRTSPVPFRLREDVDAEIRHDNHALASEHKRGRRKGIGGRKGKEQKS